MINIKIKRGDSVSFTLTFTDSDDLPIDLSQFQGIYADLSTSPVVPTEDIKLSLGSGLEIQGNILGIYLTPVQTFSLIHYKYYSDVKFKSGETLYTVAYIVFDVESTATITNYNVNI
jgi:hypothetical protein